ncbi:MAG: ABC transporter permease, partial [Planctomycetes bacterium]|nr:ABC transporter permease [Planctomycetota bacterium]
MTTSGWYHIARRDIRAAASAPLLWLILAAWLGVVHGAFALTLLEVHGRSGAAATPLYVDALWWGGLVLALFAPALTMNAWAAERSQGSWQLLMTVPQRELDLVLGKFLAAFGLMLVLIAATLGMPAVLAVVSDVSPPHALACYAGLVLLAAFLAALGTWIGLMVEGPVAAYILTFGVIAVLWLAGVGGDGGPLGPVAAAIGLGGRISSFLAGRIALADAAWLLAGAGLFILLAQGAIVALRQSGSMPWWRRAGIIG